MSVPLLNPICKMCEHYTSGLSSKSGQEECRAFPDGIPTEILDDGWDHREPLADETTLFSPLPGTEEDLQAWENVRMKGDELDFERQIVDE